MATVAYEGAERRRAERVSPAAPSWNAAAVLRPGQLVVVVNISSHGALVESFARLRPGVRTELQLVGPASRASVRGRIERCQVARLNPLCYQGVVVFDEPLDISDESIRAKGTNFPGSVRAMERPGNQLPR